MKEAAKINTRLSQKPVINGVTTHKGLYKWVSGVITPINEVITLLVTSSDPPHRLRII